MRVMLPKPAPSACACLINTPDRISERPPLLFLRKPPIASCLRSRAVAWLLPPKRPVDRDHANANKRHPNFRFDVRQEVRNPPWSASVPINERRIARREISVKPEGHTRRLDDPANDNCLIHNLDLYGRLFGRGGLGHCILMTPMRKVANSATDLFFAEQESASGNWLEDQRARIANNAVG
jgi:hypothetical protein